MILELTGENMKNLENKRIEADVHLQSVSAAARKLTGMFCPLPVNCVWILSDPL